MDQKINWEAGARFAEANYRVTRAMADSEEPPLWILGDYFGDTFAPKAGQAPKNEMKLGVARSARDTHRAPTSMCSRCHGL